LGGDFIFVVGIYKPNFVLPVGKPTRSDSNLSRSEITLRLKRFSQPHFRWKWGWVRSCTRVRI